MGVISFLSGKIHKIWGLLGSRYELQNDNIDQLKTSNTLLKENNERLQKQVDDLKAENESRKQNVAKLAQQVPQSNKGNVSSGLSTVAVAVLDFYRQLDKTMLPRDLIIHALKQKSFRRIEVESGIDQLMTAKMLSPPSEAVRTQQVKHHLLPKGKKYIVDNM